LPDLSALEDRDYTSSMLMYAITGGEGWAAVHHGQRWAHEGVQFVQLREKQLPAGELVRLATALRTVLRETGHTKLLINSRADVAIAAGADGVHLTSQTDELTPQQARHVFQAAGHDHPVISVSCHTLDEVRRAVADKADLILFGPVFEKRVAGEMVGEGVGLEALQAACAAADGIPVLALGGVTWPRAELCIEAGARGVAGIRLFG
jgi:thiamine-phosphate pyrophosphorylase